MLIGLLAMAVALPDPGDIPGKIGTIDGWWVGKLSAGCLATKLADDQLTRVQVWAYPGKKQVALAFVSDAWPSLKDGKSVNMTMLVERQPDQLTSFDITDMQGFDQKALSTGVSTDLMRAEFQNNIPIRVLYHNQLIAGFTADSAKVFAALDQCVGVSDPFTR